MSDIYNSGTVPHGGFTADIVRSTATAIVTVNVEQFTANYPTVSVDRPAADGSADDWAVVAGQATATATVQIPTASGAAVAGTALALGDWFITAAGKVNSAAEKWIIVDISMPRAMGDYYKASLGLKRDNNYTP